MRKNIIITGCNGLIGKSLCENLISKNFNIHGLDINQTVISNANFTFSKCDLSSYEETKEAINNIFDSCKEVASLIHLAGIDYKVDKLIDKKSDKEFLISEPHIALGSINKNISMVYNVIYSTLPKFIKQKKTRIVLVGSIYGSYSPNPNLYKDKNNEFFYQKPIEYSISKSTFPIIAKYLCAHYAKDGIKVNNFEPHAIIEKPEDNFINNFKKLSPMKRTCNVSEIVEAIIFLSSDRCDYLNGTTLRVDGGWNSI